MPQHATVRGQKLAQIWTSKCPGITIPYQPPPGGWGSLGTFKKPVSQFSKANDPLPTQGWGGGGSVTLATWPKMAKYQRSLAKSLKKKRCLHRRVATFDQSWPTPHGAILQPWSYHPPWGGVSHASRSRWLLVGGVEYGGINRLWVRHGPESNVSRGASQELLQQSGRQTAELFVSMSMFVVVSGS